MIETENMEEVNLVQENNTKYGDAEKYPQAELTYAILGCCMEIHKELGRGFLEIVYKDAIEIEFKRKGINYEREKKFEINYKGIILPHYYFADFVIEGNVILEVKAQQGVVDEHFKQVLNYLAVSNCKLGLLVNFGTESLKYKRLILK